MAYLRNEDAKDGANVRLEWLQHHDDVHGAKKNEKKLIGIIFKKLVSPNP